MRTTFEIALTITLQKQLQMLIMTFEVAFITELWKQLKMLTTFTVAFKMATDSNQDQREP